MKIRSAIDRYYLDYWKNHPKSTHLERFPENLEELVRTRFLRRIPEDPIFEQRTWEIIFVSQENQGIFDILSKAKGISTEKDFYRDW